MLEELRYYWECEAFPGAVAGVSSLTVQEGLNTPYQVEVEVELDDPDADVTEMLGKNVLVTLERLPLSRRFTGLVAEVWEGTVEEGKTRVQMRVVPALWSLHFRRNTRMFQEKTVPEILEDVLTTALSEYDREIEVDLTATYPTREYCIQYQETDLAFCHRLMEEEGISYCFDHEGDVEKMILRDANASFPEAPSVGMPVFLQPQDAITRDFEAIQLFRRDHRDTTTALALRDWDWTAGGDMIVEEAADGEDANGRIREKYEHGEARSLTISSYDAGVRRYQAQDGAAQASVRQEAVLSLGITGRGVGRVIGFAPGTTFELVNHPQLGHDGEYLVTRVVHRKKRFSMGTEENAEDYYNEFTCIPLSVPYRPQRRTPKPRIDGIQTALVTGPAGEEIHVDEHGRIKVQFYWDRENPADETSSCWVRCEQDWGGAGWGWWWVPRIGMEVVVHFIDGDPDRPVVTGCVYNAANQLPYPQPDEKTKSTIKSNSSIGGGGFNEFRYEDKAGSEEIYTHAQKDYDEVVENDHNTLVHHDQTNEVDNDQTQTIHNNQTERVDVDQTMSVGANRTVHVEANFDETVDGTETRHVIGDVSETFDANETRTVTGDVTEDIGADETRTVGGSQTEEIGADHTQSIDGSSTVTIGAALTETVTGGISSTTPGSQTLTAVGGMNVTAAAGVKWVAQGGVTIIAPGGVVVIDGDNNWVGQYLISAEPVSTNVIGLKIEMGGWSVGLCNIKVESHILSINLGSYEDAFKGAKTVAEAVDADAGTKSAIFAISLKG